MAGTRKKNTTPSYLKNRPKSSAAGTRRKNTSGKSPKAAAQKSSGKRRSKSAGNKQTGGASWLKRILAFLISIVLAVGGYGYYTTGDIEKTLDFLMEFPEKAMDELPDLVGSAGQQTAQRLGMDTSQSVSVSDIPEYSGQDYVVLDNNVPHFTQEEKASAAYEFYSELDWLGRCGYAEAKIDRSLMPTEKRGAIGSVKPTGWHTVKYSNVDGGYLYNRCHLIGYQLTAENANKKNLITGTRYFNTEGMLPWENQVADYIKETGDAVMYRVTPIYDGNDLVAKGVQMEGESVGSNEIQFNVFVYNIQPGIEIDYTTGESERKG